MSGRRRAVRNKERDWGVVFALTTKLMMFSPSLFKPEPEFRFQPPEFSASLLSRAQTHGLLENPSLFVVSLPSSYVHV